MEAKICKYCRSQIDKRAKICPHCRKKQSSSILLPLLLILMFLLLSPFLLFAGIGILRGYSNASKNASISQEANKMSKEDYKNACKSVSYEEIARDKDGLKGQKVTFTGEIIQATSGTYRMNVTKTAYSYTDTILFEIDEDTLTKNILEGDIVTIWGESKGQYTYTAVLGNKITVPRIGAVYISLYETAESETETSE